MGSINVNNESVYFSLQDSKPWKGLTELTETFVSDKQDVPKSEITDILERYKKYQIKLIDTNCDDDIKFIRESSELTKIAYKLETQAKKELKKLYSDNPDKIKEIDENINHFIYIAAQETPEDRKELEEIYEYREIELKNLNEKIKDVTALISIAKTFEEKIKVLENYGIIDDEGKIRSW